MPSHEVTSSTHIAEPADLVWSKLRDFHGLWHPSIDTMAVEHDDKGGLLRAFTVKNEKTLYREKLTWFSDSERSMAYTHVQGIAGVEHYDARLELTATDRDDVLIRLSAHLEASEPRATQIAMGTQSIFDSAIAAIESLDYSSSTIQALASEFDDLRAADNPQPRTVIIEGSPALAVSVIDAADDSSKTLCLFLHGIGGNRTNWSAQLAAVAPFCTSAALDLRGYGDSDLGDRQTTIDDYCRDIKRVLEWSGAAQLILCGLSYGAWIATSFAMRYPELLSALVLSGGCTGMSEAQAEEREAFRRSREIPLSEGKTPADFAPDVVAVLLGPKANESIKDELLASMQAISASTYGDALRCFTNPEEQFDFSKINLPVLLMTGDADKLATPREILNVAKRIHDASANPDVRYECLLDAGHVCNLEAASAYNRPLIELVQRIAR